MLEPPREENQCKLSELVRPGLSSEELLKLYDQIQTDGTTYDKLFGTAILSPILYAETLADHYHKEVRQDVEVIDIGAGTGIVGMQLKKHGFRVLDAVEPSREMLRDALAKNVYRRTYDFMITTEESSLSESQYDALITCGTLVENHLPLECLHEFVRVVKPGGVIVLGIREIYLETVEAYRDKLEPLMQELEKKGKWKMLLRRVCPGIHMGQDGIIWKFQVTK